ncbi:MULTISPECIES: HNH endonuclease [Agrobacterium]|uniref:HNH endonuclease n=1 Tax=Agrobacterium tumefaciens TaxID=358 RepID=UPI00157279C3|nr:HNH endonuclease [Agrobacterium tumefaciens]NSZ06316.1 HNH endonuclease [Agrobacterium tumefaciens]
MRNLPKPSRDTAKADLEEVLYTYTYKNEQRGYAPTDAEILDVLAIYDLYDQTLGAPAAALKGPNLTEGLRGAIRHAYPQTYENGKIPHIRETAFEKVDMCPMCGIDPPVELDHHLAKSIYEPLSVYSRNLVPLCEACNGAKLASDSGKYAHAYFDELPDVQFLRVEVDIHDGGLVTTYEIDDAAALPPPLLAKIKFQMEALSLNARFKKDVNSYMVAHTTGLHMAADMMGGGGTRYYLRKQADIEAAKFYRNHWRPVLLYALAAHDGFCDGGFRTVLPDVQAARQAEDLIAKEAVEAA